MSEYDPNNTQSVVDVATRAAVPTEIGDGKVFAFPLPDGGHVETVDVEALIADYRDQPTRKSGHYAVHDAESFLEYLVKHSTGDTEVWADVTRSRVVGVLNAHGPANPDTADDGAAGWGDHRVTYDAALTDEWKAWTAHDGKLLPQRQFAEHIEDRSADIVTPSGADMLEVAQTFQATVGVKFESSKLLSSGERQFEYRETVEAKAGRAGRLEIPTEFLLGLTPFEGADVQDVRARFRYRINDGALLVGYRLDRPDNVLRMAFQDVVSQINDNTEVPVLRGVSA